MGPDTVSFNPCHAKYLYVQHSSPIFILLNCSFPVVSMYFSLRVEHIVDADQIASLEAS